jgi:hypothetical protein
MNIHARAAAAATFSAMLALCTGANAQVPQPKHPAKAAPAAPLTTPFVAESFAKQPVVSVVPKKPPVVTAVAPRSPLTGPGRSIIFVGGKPQGGGDAALNPQPIPPGHVNPVDPIH